MLVLLVISSKDGDGCTSFGQAQRNAAANPTVTTGHHHDPAGQVKEFRHFHATFPSLKFR